MPHCKRNGRGTLEQKGQMMSPTRTKTAKTARAAFDAATAPSDTAAAFDVFKFAVPSAEVPVAFREFAEKGVAQARDTYAKLKTAAEEATDMVEDTYESARQGAFTLSLKALEAAKTNTDASFALARDLFGARTFAEVIELQTAYARKQFDAVAGQVKEFQELTQKYVADTSKPVTAQFEKSFKDIRAA
jgi:phasin